ncbi:unnamed protein product [Clonostachys rosea]|uniref:SLC26A/SulP transporter domain-containing protein n=1 Tax=Bionectria ochroleuca TaxID=29856 RepID=A0ABY6TQM3_BIOOC|nr:unnamed protein product [Clonostachys rosea]
MGSNSKKNRRSKAKDAARKAEDVAPSTQEPAAGAYHRIRQAIRDNPKLVATSAGVVLGGITLVLAVLKVVGFRAARPVAEGSSASALQSAGLAGTILSAVQSGTMGGLEVQAAVAFITIFGATVGGALVLQFEPSWLFILLMVQLLVVVL